MTIPAAVGAADAVAHYVGDIDVEFLGAALATGSVAWDIETSGLDWRTERIATCQLHVPGSGYAIVRMDRDPIPPPLLCSLLGRSDIVKIFHHAMFDLRFMVRWWRATPQSIFCTKIASKLVAPDASNGDHSLKPLVRRFLGIDLDKGEQQSDWFATRLSAEQIAYAVADVAYLPALADALRDELRARGDQQLAERCFAHIPTRVELEVRGLGDPFTY